AISEAYHSVRTALQFSTPAGTPDVLLITSTRPAEGKSTTSRSVASDFARLGMRVLLIDADLRNPSLHRLVGAENSAGLSNLLAGIGDLQTVVQTTSLPGLSFMACGPLPPSPAELLAGPRLRSLLAQARDQFDLVVLDGPPVMGLADAPILANVATGVLLVIEAAGTRRGQATSALRRLNQGGPGKVVGAILTKFNAKQASYGYGYSYAYDYNYGAQPQLERHG
ncbi:MAG: CpsD/CapB family tyrosine-protein kinase, partial [Ignavibacteriales bacterium]